jgi:hypothetical protein
MIRLRRAGSVGFAAIALTLFAAGCGSDAKLTSSTSPSGGAATVASTTGAGTAAAIDTVPATDAGTGPGTGVTSAGGSGGAPSATTPTTGDVDSSLDDDIFTATSDLATKLNIDAATIETLSATTTEWPNGALGCPKPGMSYTQQTVSGAVIVLFAEGKQYSYHEGGSRGPFLCETAPPSTLAGG